MRRFIALFLMFALSAVALSAQVTVENVLPKVKLLPMDSMDLNMRYSSEMQRLYAQVDMDVDTSKLDADSYWGVFLNKEAKISGVMVNNTGSGHYLMRGLGVGNFEPPLADAKYLKPDAKAQFVGIDMRGLEAFPAKVHVSFNYFLDVPEFAANEIKMPNSGFAGDSFWYPHYLNDTISVNITLATTQYYKLMLGNMTIGFKAEDFLRKHQTTFFDMPGQPLNFRLIKE